MLVIFKIYKLQNKNNIIILKTTMLALIRASAGIDTRNPARRYLFNIDPKAIFFNLLSPIRPCQLNKFLSNFIAIANCR
jgi:hypothetical protein